MRGMNLLGKIDLQGRSSWVKVARMYVRSVLYRAGRKDVDDVETLVSEVFTNAVRHSESGRRPGGVVTLCVYDDGETVRVEVTDEGSPDSVPRIPERSGLFDEGGRGLWMVQELSSAWGWGQHTNGRTVWFEIRTADCLRDGPQGVR
ncbi:anti-sigma regulatory factor (Ser/Thr protein kinase) [Sphaerisporangium rubeum]|uniref:Anti-sigma regulatory factor (Ser/Thr protein kinase) n=2 Tax=Sphaerisporangium rubeum TaxID=321317 RepID=A0A7X0M4V3_9ACTN|nr:anti-sigma regulatory factor (Ser/Thr protein kinase) [Sphaerisporangium rubeum]